MEQSLSDGCNVKVAVAGVYINAVEWKGEVCLVDESIARCKKCRLNG